MKTSAMDTTGRSSGGVLGKPAEWWQNSRTFLAEVRNELKRVTWPNKKEVYATTVVVILVSSFFGLYLAGVDMVLGAIVQSIFRLFGVGV